MINFENIRWDITSRCNLNCAHCFNVKKKCSEEISSNEIKAIVNTLLSAGHNVQKITLAGREPTMRDDLKDIISFFSFRGISTVLSSNGTTHDSEYFIDLIKKGVAGLMISIDGATKESHEFVRGEKTFNKVLKLLNDLSNFKKTNNYKFQLSLSYTINNRNKNEIKKLLDIVDSLDVDSLLINPVDIVGNAINNKADLELSPEELFWVFEEIALFSKNLKRLDPDEIRIGAYPLEIKMINLKFNTNFPIIIGSCSAKSTLYIDYTGQAFPCYAMPFYTGENKIKDTFKQWDVLNEDWHIGKEKFSSFYSNLEQYFANASGCRECFNGETCLLCPLLQNSLKEKRCHSFLNKIDTLINSLDFDSRTKIEKRETVSFSFKDGQLLVENTTGTFKRVSTYEMDKETNDCLNDIVKLNDYKLIAHKYAKNKSGFDYFLKFFIKEEVLKNSHNGII